MPKQYYATNGINTYVSPTLVDGQLIHAVNVDSSPYGAKRKRGGYQTYLNNPDDAKVNSLWQFGKNNGTEFYNYRASGSKVYYSAQGTGDWTVCGNGTITNGAHVGYAILNDTMIVGDGQGSTRHTTNGTSFTNTTLAPIGEYFAQFQNRVFIGGTASDTFYSTTNDATNWSTSGTSDSSSIPVPGAGKMSALFTAFDRLYLTKTARNMFKWDGFSLVDLATSYGPSSPYSIGKAEGFPFFLNQYGHYGFTSGLPNLLSNAIQNQFYNLSGSAIAGTAFATIPGVCHRYDYLASVGTLTDDFVRRPISDAIIKYDFQKNEYVNWSFADKPTAFLSALDTSNNQQLYFGDGAGNTYRYDPATITDNGDGIASELVFVYTYEAPEFEKTWKHWRGVFNPGCQAKVQVACSNVYTYESLDWQELGDVTSGVADFRFAGNKNRSRFLFVRIYDTSSTLPWVYYGSQIEALVHEH